MGYGVKNLWNGNRPQIRYPVIYGGDGIRSGDEVCVDFDTGVITNVTTGETYQAESFPPFIQNIIAKGGLLNSIAQK